MKLGKLLKVYADETQMNLPVTIVDEEGLCICKTTVRNAIDCLGKFEVIHFSVEYSKSAQQNVITVECWRFPAWHFPT